MALLVSLLVSAQPLEGQGDPMPGEVATTGFLFHTNWVLVPVTAGGETGLWIMDTGASSSVIDSTFAHRVGVEWKDPVRITGAVNQATVPTAVAPDLDVAGIPFASRTMAVLDLIGLVQDRTGLSVHGILGKDFLRRYVTRIDYARRRVTFLAADDFVYEGDGRVYSDALTDWVFRLPVTVDGEFHGSWAVDTGAGGLSFHHPYAEEQDLLDRPGARFMGVGAAGPSERKRVRFSSIELAGITFPEPLIDVPLQASGAFGNPTFDGNLGNDLFRYFVLYLDYHRGQLILEEGGNCCTKDPDLLSGLFLGLDDDGSIAVRRVLPGSCAEEAGLETGDVITALDGDPVSGPGGIWVVRNRLKGEAGTRLAFSVSRGQVSLPVTMMLFDYFQTVHSGQR